MNLNVMQINRQSYEEFFLLYADDELNDADKKAVEEFVHENPDLADEFALIQETVMQPDESVIFEGRELLYRSEQEERKIFYMRWFRIGAAAAIMIALSVVGWLFVDRKEMHQQPVAMKQTPVKTTDAVTKNATGNIDTKENKSVAGINSNNQSTETRKARKTTTESDRRTSNAQSSNNTKHESINKSEKENTEENLPQPEVALQKESPVHDVVNTDVALAPIDVQVQPHALQPEQEQQPDDASFTKATYDEQPEKNDMIYFANTSLTKKTKLREIFRKTTRYIDRVTSLQ